MMRSFGRQSSSRAKGNGVTEKSRPPWGPCRLERGTRKKGQLVSEPPLLRLYDRLGEVDLQFLPPTADLRSDTGKAEEHHRPSGRLGNRADSKGE